MFHLAQSDPHRQRFVEGPEPVSMVLSPGKDYLGRTYWVTAESSMAVVGSSSPVRPKSVCTWAWWIQGARQASYTAPCRDWGLPLLWRSLAAVTVTRTPPGQPWRCLLLECYDHSFQSGQRIRWHCSRFYRHRVGPPPDNSGV